MLAPENTRAAPHESIDTPDRPALSTTDSAGRIFDTLYAKVPIGVALLAAGGDILRCNGVFEKITGYTAAELLRMTEQALHAPESTEAPGRADAGFAGRPYLAPREREYIARGGIRVPVRVSGAALDDAGGDGRYWWFVEDITARRQMMDALKQSESEARMLAAVASHTDSMVVITNAGGRIEWVNDAFVRLTGFTRDQVEGRSPGRLLQGPDTDLQSVAAMSAAVAAGRAFSMEVLNYTRERRPYWVSIECAPVFDHLGRLERFVSIERDISAQREAAQALRASQERYQRAIEGASDIVFERDLVTERFFLSERICAVLGIEHAAIPRTSVEVYGLIHPQDRADHERQVEAMLKSRETVIWESRFLCGDGGYRWLRVRGKTIRDGAGVPILTSGTVSDVHDAKLASEELRVMQVRYARALEGASDGIWERAAGSDLMQCSDRVAEILGYLPDTLPSDRFALTQITHPDDREAVCQAMSAMFRGRRSVTWEARMRGPDGRYRWIRGRGRAVLDPRGKVLLTSGTVTDIQEAKLAEAAMHALQARHQRALDGSNDGIWEREVATDMFYFSPRFEEILGYAPGAMPRSRERWLGLAHPDDLLAHKAGAARMLESNAAAQWETRFRMANGEYRWLRFRGIASRDADGRVSATSGTASDIHAARLAEAELRRHRDNLAQLVEARTVGLEQATREADAQRLLAEKAREAAERSRQAAVAASMAKSEFLANMSHELRTPMHGIISFANFGVEKFDRVEPAKLLHYFRNIQKSGSRLLLLLNDLLDLSKLEAGKMLMQRQPTNLGALVDEAMAEFEALARSRGIELRANLAERPLVDIDAGRMLQVLRNLLSNALKFSAAGGQVEVTCRRLPVEDSGAHGRQVELCVRDGGIGIPEDELEMVFDKFVQSSKTKSGAGGTGLGLAISREIVIAHGGLIRACNNAPPAHGAVFVVCLPLGANERAPRALAEIS